MTFFDSIRDVFLGGPAELSALETIAQAGPVVKGVLFILLVFSVVSWGIMLHKLSVIRAARAQSKKFLRIFWTNPRLNLLYEEARKLPKSPLAQVFRGGYQEFNRMTSTARSVRGISRGAGVPEDGDTGSLGTELFGVESIERVLRRNIMEEVTRLESNLTFLATTGSTCPFIGLFGTVWGIMNAFKGIGVKSSVSIAVVSSGISEALIATAVGLFAAIPAVVAYNYFISKIKVLTTEMDNFSFEYLNIVERHLKRMR